MDETDALQALEGLITEISEKPYDIQGHARHIRLTQSNEALESQVEMALEMMTSYLAAGDAVWLPLLDAKEKQVDPQTVAGKQELLSLYARAEADYLSIPILKKHLDFIVEQHAYELDHKPDELEKVYPTGWTRAAIAEVVNKGVGHLTQSHVLWNKQRDWEMEMLERASANEKEELIRHVEQLHLLRLKQPHSTHSETSQSYSTFTSNYKPPQEYENLLVAASKASAYAVKSYDRRDRLETALSGGSLSAFANYIEYERKARTVDMLVMTTVYERAIAEAAKQWFNGDGAAEGALRTFWIGYIDALRTNAAEESQELAVLKRAVRSVPGSGEVWARYIRFLERASESDPPLEDLPHVAEIFVHAISTKLIQKDVEDVVPLFLARAGYEKRRIEAGKADEDAFATLIATLEQGISLCRDASPAGDIRMRLEKYLTDIYLRLADLPSAAIDVWKATAKRYKTSYLAWTSYTDVLIKQDQHAEARAVFKDLVGKNLDWPEAIFEAWISFEHLYGSVDELDECLDRVGRAQTQLNTRRAKEAQQATYQAMQVAMEHQAASVPVSEVINGGGAGPSTGDAAAMDVDVDTSSGTKRKADDMSQSDDSKRPRLGQQPPPLKRDRENSTVFVGALPSDATEDDLKALFKDCGDILEVKVTQLANERVATVEFTDRDAVPVALTKDKKRMHDHEVAVHMAWKSTLYVTNFPESADDTSMRQLFGQYGTIFDIRWPSKKFKATRRFCYVQYTSPASAEAALTLHGHELEPGMPVNVYISNPERKKQRTDADADKREVYVAGLSKFTTDGDLEKVFKTYGSLKEVRMAKEKDGNCKGFAFIEFEEEAAAQLALAANNYELKGRRIAVTLSDSRVRARKRTVNTETGFGRKADTRVRSVRVRNLPAGTQEGLLQQALEKHASLVRVEVFSDVREAVVELQNAAEAGKLLLRTDPITFNGAVLEITEEAGTRTTSGPSKPANVPPATGGMFVPRAAGASRPRAGLGHKKKLGTGVSGAGVGAGGGGAKGQDDFRKMLGGS